MPFSVQSITEDVMAAAGGGVCAWAAAAAAVVARNVRREKGIDILNLTYAPRGAMCSRANAADSAALECSVCGHTEPHAAVTLLPLNLGATPDGSYRLRAMKQGHSSPASPDCCDCCAPSLEFAPALLATPVRIRGGRGPDAPVQLPLKRVAVFCIRGSVNAKDVAVGIEANGWNTVSVHAAARALHDYGVAARLRVARSIGSGGAAARHVTGVAIRVGP